MLSLINFWPLESASSNLGIKASTHFESIRVFLCFMKDGLTNFNHVGTKNIIEQQLTMTSDGESVQAIPLGKEATKHLSKHILYYV